MTRNETHVHDISTLANFKDWAMSIGAALTAFGWTQSADTGQVNWGAIAAVPAAGSFVYEIWKPGDGLTAFYVKIEYGNTGGNSAVKIQSGTGTNGSGTLTGFTTVQSIIEAVGNNGATLWSCLYCGDSSSFSVIMWRDHASANFAFGFDRSRNASGAVTATYFTQFATRDLSVYSSVNECYTQQSVVFGVGTATRVGATQFGSATTWHFATIVGGAVTGSGNTPQSMAFNGNKPLCPVFPLVGYYDNPTLVFAHAPVVDFNEMAVITATLYGASHSFIFSEIGGFAPGSGESGAGLALCMRWE